MKKVLNHLLGARHENSLAAQGFQWAGWAWFACYIAFVLGVSLPIIKMTKFAFVTSEYSILSVIADLISDGSFILALVVFGFSVAGPICKLDQLWRIWRRYDANGEMVRRAIQRLEFISRWSMADIFIVAIIVVVAKTGGFLADAKIGIGLYFFAASAFGTMLLGHSLKSKIDPAD